MWSFRSIFSFLTGKKKNEQIKRIPDRKIFIEAHFNQEINEKGFVIIDFFNEEEVKKLSDFYYHLSKEKDQSFTTYAVNDYEYRKETDNQLKEIFEPKINQLLYQYKAFWGNYFLKTSGSPAMPLHADFQYVNESETISLNIWSPLVDTSPSNGALGIVPFSHFIIDQKRGTNLPRFYSPYDQEIIQQYGVILSMKAGQAIIYDHRLLHFSTPNQSNMNRLAATMVCIPEDHALVHYYSQNEQEYFSEYPISSVEDFLITDFKSVPAHLTPARSNLSEKFRTITPGQFIPFRKEIQLIREKYSKM